MARKLSLIEDQFDFNFTRNWFLNRNLSTFREYVYPEWKDKPISYLEIGVFEGMSMVWMMQRILTHKDSFGVGVDPWLMTNKATNEFMEEVMDRAIHNTSTFDRCTLIRSNSVEVLTKMIRTKNGFLGIKANSLDLCMIDGNHHELGVLDDAQRVLQLLRVGGWVLFDDVENRLTKVAHVKQGLSTFTDTHKDEIKLLWKHRYMECYEKVA